MGGSRSDPLVAWVVADRPERTVLMTREDDLSGSIAVIPLNGIPEIRAGDDLGTILINAVRESSLVPTACDILVVAQKIVSKAEGRHASLARVSPSTQAQDLAKITRKDPRLVELILRESVCVMRAVPDVLIVRHRLGLVMANAGIDRSNVGGSEEDVLLLPLDPDASAGRLRQALGLSLATPPAVIVSDSFGRAWRLGTVNIAIGAAGLPSLLDGRGERDRYGRMLESTELGFADAVAAAAGLAMGEAAEGRPAVLVRGVTWGSLQEQPASALVRSRATDLFP